MPNCAVCTTELTGTVNDSTIVIWLNPETDDVEHLYFCKDRTVAEPPQEEGEEGTERVVSGCQNQLLTPELKKQFLST